MTARKRAVLSVSRVRGRHENGRFSHAPSLFAHGAALVRLLPRRTFCNGWTRRRTKRALAAAYAQVNNHAGRLLCLLEDSGGDAWLEYAYERWAEVEDALFLCMLDILARENDRGAKHALRDKGRRFLLAPLMRRNDCAHESWTAVDDRSARQY